MYKRILISTDGSELSDRGLNHGLALAQKVGSAVVVVVVGEVFLETVAGIVPLTRFASPDQLEHASQAAAEWTLSRAAELAKAHGVACEMVYVKRKRSAADGILETASSRKCDLIVMSSHGWRGAERVLLGSQTHAVVTRSKIPVLVVK
jgi:nucleotide-binding universal stress UspA family protein